MSEASDRSPDRGPAAEGSSQLRWRPRRRLRVRSVGYALTAAVSLVLLFGLFVVQRLAGDSPTTLELPGRELSGNEAASASTSDPPAAEPPPSVLVPQKPQPARFDQYFEQQARTAIRDQRRLNPIRIRPLAPATEAATVDEVRSAQRPQAAKIR